MTVVARRADDALLINEIISIIDACTWPTTLRSTRIRALERDHLACVSYQLIEVVHPGDGATARSHQTVGFHANPSDIEIPFEFFHRRTARFRFFQKALPCPA